MRTKRSFEMWISASIIAAVISGCAPGLAGTTPSAVPTPAESTLQTPASKANSPSPTAKPAAAQPKYGGALALPTPSDPPNLDVHRANSALVFAPLGPIYNSMVQFDQSNKVVPDLAESWQVSPDGKVYTFALRKGVKWHDGKPFTSADARFSLDRLAAYDVTSAFIGAIDRVETPDENTLKATLKYPQAGFLSILGHGRAFIGPKHIIETRGDLKRDAVGTGPFKLKEYSSGVSLTVEKNKEYFLKDRPYLDKITFYVIKDMSTRFAGFRTARLHVYGHPPTNGELGQTHLDILKKEAPQVLVRPYDTQQNYGLMPNWTRGPWSDIRVRRAAFLAIDRQKGLAVVAEGVGKLGVSVFTGEWALPEAELRAMPGFRQPKDQDIAEAKRLLSEAGFPEGFKSTILVRSGIPIHERYATFASEQLSKIGIDLTLQIVDYAIWTEARSKHNFDTMLGMMNVEPIDPDALGRYVSRKLGGVYAGGDDDKLLELFDKQAEEGNESERKKIVFDLQRRVAETVPHLTIAWQTSFIAFWPEVKNYVAESGTFSHTKLEDIWLSK